MREAAVGNALSPTVISVVYEIHRHKMLNISFYLSHVKYAVLLISDGVIIVVRSLFIFSI